MTKLANGVTEVKTDTESFHLDCDTTHTTFSDSAVMFGRQLLSGQMTSSLTVRGSLKFLSTLLAVIKVKTSNDRSSIGAIAPS